VTRDVRALPVDAAARVLAGPARITYSVLNRFKTQ